MEIKKKKTFSNIYQNDLCSSNLALFTFEISSIPEKKTAKQKSNIQRKQKKMWMNTTHLQKRGSFLWVKLPINSSSTFFEFPIRHLHPPGACHVLPAWYVRRWVRQPSNSDLGSPPPEGFKPCFVRGYTTRDLGIYIIYRYNICECAYIYMTYICVYCT